jgi:hypothetical protein
MTSSHQPEEAQIDRVHITRSVEDHRSKAHANIMGIVTVPTGRMIVRSDVHLDSSTPRAASQMAMLLFKHLGGDLTIALSMTFRGQ